MQTPSIYLETKVIQSNYREICLHNIIFKIQELYSKGKKDFGNVYGKKTFSKGS